MTRIEHSTGDFWRRRNLETQLFVDRYTTNNVSFYLAYIAYKIGLTPNQLSAASGAFSGLALIAAVSMSTKNLAAPVLTIYMLSQVSYLFDCADGQLARTTGRTSRYGAFLDISMDLASAKLQFGAFFIFMYQYYLNLGDRSEAHLWLFGGLAFIFFSIARFGVSQFFSGLMPDTYASSRGDVNALSEILKNCVSQQVSLLNMLVVLVSPRLCLLIYAAQSVLLCAAWLRYFKRGRAQGASAYRQSAAGIKRSSPDRAG